MNDFQKINLKNFQTTIVGDNNETRTVVIVGESMESAKAQIEKFVAHLKEATGITFTASSLVELSHYHVTYTEGAWEKLKTV